MIEKIQVPAMPTKPDPRRVEAFAREIAINILSGYSSIHDHDERVRARAEEMLRTAYRVALVLDEHKRKTAWRIPAAIAAGFVCHVLIHLAWP